MSSSWQSLGHMVFILGLASLAHADLFLRGKLPSQTGQVNNSTHHSSTATQQVHTGFGINATVLPHAQVQHNASQLPYGGIERPPRIYFLFLAVDKISNLDVWQAFFAQAPTSQYRAYVHCKEQACVNQVASSVLVAVPTVPSYYCTDLVSPMNQLLSQALARDEGETPNAADKFAFVSDSTLPSKPFSTIYATLAQRSGSDFCVFPSNEWADAPAAVGLDMAAKHHQWITLDRGHAEKASALWAGGQMHNFMTYFSMNHMPYTWANNSYGDSRNFGCLDEFWHMAALFGTFSGVDPHRERLVDLYQFTGSPLRVTTGTGWQGSCDTFVMWSKYLYAAGRNPFQDLHNSLDSASIPHGGNSARPGWWDTISPQGIGAIRSSDFLFVRKFIDNPTLSTGGHFATTYAQLVFV